jgi:hypothetical protein
MIGFSICGRTSETLRMTRCPTRRDRGDPRPGLRLGCTDAHEVSQGRGSWCAHLF